MATEPPRTVRVTFPEWMWSGHIQGWLAEGKLNVSAGTLADRVVTVELEVVERATGSSARLVTVEDLEGSEASQARLMRAESAVGEIVTPSDELQRRLPVLEQRARAAIEFGNLGPLFNIYQANVMLASRSSVPEVIGAVQAAIRELREAETNLPCFPHSTIHFVLRDRALIIRTKLPTILLRLQHDTTLRDGNLNQARAALQDGELVFASGTGIGDGLVLLDAYLAPLFGALSPFVWCFPVTRPAGTIVFSLGKAISGTLGDAAEPLQILPTPGPEETVPAPRITQRSGAAAMTWWARRLDKLLSILSDPAVFSSSSGWYRPSEHFYALLSVEQLFRRTASIQHTHRNAHARRVLLFTVFDTLHRLMNTPLIEMCDVDSAEMKLERLRGAMSSDVASVLLPAASRAVLALRAVQNGFFIRRQTEVANIVVLDADGTTVELDAREAAAEYLLVLRNATHGYGTNRKERKAIAEALLVHHNGALSNDLPLLAYLYLLDLLVKPETLRRNLFREAGANSAGPGDV